MLTNFLKNKARMKPYGTTRYKTLIDHFFNLGLCLPDDQGIESYETGIALRHTDKTLYQN